VLSFFTKPDLKERISQSIVDYGLSVSDWRCVLGPSEFTLPKYVNENPEAKSDLVLVDGGHFVHTVFCDFTYGYASLKQRGLILLDDLQMPSVAILYQCLKASRFVEEVDNAGKTAIFRKNDASRLPGPWGDAALPSVLVARSGNGTEEL
jgi:hypothetical protein